MTMPNKGKNKNELLRDLEDSVPSMDQDFQFVGHGDIEKISSILGQSQNNSLIYVGKTGLGKTATIQGIAQRKRKSIDGSASYDERLPLHIIDRRFLVLDVNTLFEKNDPELIQASIQKIFSELEKPGKHVLIIEDANDWLKGIEDNQCHGLISMFVRELKKGAFQSILMVRDEPGKNNLGKVLGAHSEFTELFTILEKKPPTKEEILKIMEKTKPNLEKHHDGLHITEDANHEIVNLTSLYPNLRIYMREQPARSLKLRDQIASIFVSRRQSKPPEIDELQARLQSLAETDVEEKKALENRIEDINLQWKAKAGALGQAYLEKRKNEHELLILEEEREKLVEDLKQKIRAEKGSDPTDHDLNLQKTPDIREVESFIRQTRRDLEQATTKAQALKVEHNDKLILNISDVRNLFSELSGIPSKDLNANEAMKALNLEKRLKEKIFGQDETVESISDAIKRARAGLREPQQPIGSFMLFGSSGIGKSFVGECLAEELYEDVSAMTVIDMSEFMEKHTVSRLIGAPPGYAGYGEGGLLTNAVRNKPYQVVLLDEIEKAHPDVFKILLQVLDKGRLSDELGTVDFKNTVFIMTTNMGQDMSFDPDRNSRNSETELKREARKLFPQELINRVDSLLLLKAHTPENIKRMLIRDISTLNKNLSGRNMEVVLPTADIDVLVRDKYKLEEGARQIRKFLKSELTSLVADIVLSNSSEKTGGLIKAAYKPGESIFDVQYHARVNDDLKPQIDNPVLYGGASRPVGQGAVLRAVFAPVMA